tara:strand:+ start:81 stop:347 length:267 start_codon:yes stop_codon:yes gene_type:complete
MALQAEMVGQAHLLRFLELILPMPVEAEVVVTFKETEELEVQAVAVTEAEELMVQPLHKLELQTPVVAVVVDNTTLLQMELQEVQALL